LITKLIGVKWFYKSKYKPSGEIDCFKVRLMAKGYKQKPDIDYFEVVTHAAILDIVCLIISILA